MSEPLQPSLHSPLRMGRIGYLNVLPIYHALESGVVPHKYELVYGPPAMLNDLMSKGGLVAASTSCIEYARRPERYWMLPDLSIGSNGPVQSVLLLSRRPVEKLEECHILVSAETHTSAALLRILMKDRYGLSDLTYTIGSATELVASGNPPTAFLAIGDEALRLRRHPLYPHVLDLGHAWTEWTALPFIFGLWVAEKKTIMAQPRLLQPEYNPATLLARSKRWGQEHMDAILDIAEQNYPNMTREEHKDYFTKGLCYNLGEKEQEGMRLFWHKLVEHGFIPAVPRMDFLPQA
ncbi:menaquinone biosynthesis protein [Desulfovibrio sp. OttesenSCG-928-G15]|nr:menaquinone biosynthesis protein [Desulfovibrio sp. OttesenSCG-928-G15]